MKSISYVIGLFFMAFYEKHSKNMCNYSKKIQINSKIIVKYVH